jgi:signal transduction histidine kinase
MGRPARRLSPRLLTLGAFLTLAVGATARGDENPPPVNTLRAVAESFLEPGALGPVDVEAVVTGRYPQSGITLRDDTGATFAVPVDPTIVVAPGDRVRVRGAVYRDGVYVNGIRAETIERLDHGPAPAPREIAPADLAMGAVYHDLVTMTGVVRLVDALNRSRSSLMVNVAGVTVEVRTEWVIPDAEADRLVDAEVQVTGFGAGEINGARQLIRPYVRVLDPAGIRTIAAAGADPFAAPPVPLARVGVGLRRGHRVKVSGVATARGGTGDGVFLAAGDHGVFVSPAVIDDAVRSIEPGFLVEAVGFATPGPAAITLDDAVLRITGTGAVPPPVPLPDTASRQRSSDALMRFYREMWRDALPIEVEVDTTSRTDRGGTTELVGTTPGRKVTIRCRFPDPPVDALPGSRLRLRGVCRVTATDRDLAKPVPVAFDLWPAAGADVAIVRAAPWWMRPGAVRTLAMTLAGSGVAAVGAATWVVVLRRQVRRQVRIIEGQLRTEAVLEERQRIAREFHDSLEQDLAAMALRLDAATHAVAGDEVRTVLAQQRAAVLRLQDESHQFVWDVRDAALAERPLAESLAALADDLRHLSPVPIGLRITGPVPTLPSPTRRHLLRIVREAVVNAVSHAHASAIEVTVAAEEGRLVVAVRDDGEGFDVAACERRAGHFGLRGMRERAWRLGATLDIESSPRSGSRIVVSVDPGTCGNGDPPARATVSPATVSRRMPKRDTIEHGCSDRP